MSKLKPTAKEQELNEQKYKQQTVANLKLSAEYQKYNWEIMHYTLLNKQLEEEYNNHMKQVMEDYITKNSQDIVEQTETPAV